MFRGIGRRLFVLILMAGIAVVDLHPVQIGGRTAEQSFPIGVGLGEKHPVVLRKAMESLLVPLIGRFCFPQQLLRPPVYQIIVGRMVEPDFHSQEHRHSQRLPGASGGAVSLKPAVGLFRPGQLFR